MCDEFRGETDAVFISSRYPLTTYGFANVTYGGTGVGYGNPTYGRRAWKSNLPATFAI